jgi:PAS domain S-box-containing protein
LDGVVLAWNDVAEDLFGWSRDDAVGRQMTDLLVSNADRGAAFDIVHAVERGDPWTGEFPVQRADGDVVRISAHVAPLRDESGEVIATICAAEDVTELRVAEALANDLSEHLLLALAAGELGTWRWDIATGITTWDPTMARLCDVDLDEFDGTFEAWIATLHPDDRDRTLQIVEDALANIATYELEHRVVLPDGSIRWVLCRGKVTSTPDGTPTGTIGCASDITERKQAELDSEERAAEAERSALVERQARQRLEYLARLNDAALSATDHGDLMRAVTRAAVPHLGDWCAVHYVGEPNTPPLIEVAHVDPDKVRWVHDLQAKYPFDPDAPTGVAAVIRTGEQEVIEIDTAFIDAAIDASTTIPQDEAREIADALHLTSMITVPLITKRGIVGAIQFVSAESGRRYSPDDVALAEAAAGRVAAALDNVWLADQYRGVAVALQQALLPVDIPVIDGLDIAVRYWAAGSVNEVGGDFYDVFETGPGRYGVVIGDVCGTGPQAAAVTAKARHTIRAAARHGATPLEVVEWVNDAILASHRDRFCTVLYAQLERTPDGWELQSVSCGHPLPVHVTADGQGRPVGTAGTLAGVFRHIDVHVTTTRLGPGDTLLLYTDGITDVRPPHDLLDADLRELIVEATTTSSSADDVLERLGQRIEGILPFDRRHDDMALVAIRVD